VHATWRRLLGREVSLGDDSLPLAPMRVEVDEDDKTSEGQWSGAAPAAVAIKVAAGAALVNDYY
jgi:hypothetical protein